MSASKVGGPLQSPWVYDSGSDSNGNRVTLTINFNTTTHALANAVLHRDAGCMYKKIYIGLGPDGTADSTTHVFGIGNLEGDRNITAAGLQAVGLTTIDDVIALGQITAGP
jgi:hypothetical protein